MHAHAHAAWSCPTAGDAKPSGASRLAAVGTEALPPLWSLCHPRGPLPVARSPSPEQPRPRLRGRPLPLAARPVICPHSGLKGRRSAGDRHPAGRPHPSFTDGFTLSGERLSGTWDRLLPPPPPNSQPHRTPSHHCLHGLCGQCHLADSICQILRQHTQPNLPRASPGPGQPPCIPPHPPVPLPPPPPGPAPPLPALPAQHAEPPLGVFAAALTHVGILVLKQEDNEFPLTSAQCTSPEHNMYFALAGKSLV